MKKKMIAILALAAGAGGCGAIDWNRMVEPQIEAGGTQVTNYQSPTTGLAVQGMTVGDPSRQIIASAEAERISSDAEYRRAEAAHIPAAEAGRIDAESTYVRARAECVSIYGPAQCEGFGYGFGGFGTQYLADPVYAETLRGMWAGGQNAVMPGAGGSTGVDAEARSAVRELSDDQTAIRSSLRRHYQGAAAPEGGGQ